MIEREKNTTVVSEREPNNPLLNLVVAALVILGAILLYNYYNDDTRTETQTTQTPLTDENTTDSTDDTTLPPTAETTSQPTTQ